MDGCKLIIVSGIDGGFAEFNNAVEPLLCNQDCLKIPYNKFRTFTQNIGTMRQIINKLTGSLVIVGWSIGAVSAAFLADCKNINSVILINAFFSRSEVLKRRNIQCDEEVTIASTYKQPVNYTIIAGKLDNKIPYVESEKIACHYSLSPERLLIYNEAKHNLCSFPKGSIANIINFSML